VSVSAPPALRESQARESQAVVEPRAASSRTAPADAGPVVVPRQGRFEGLLTFRGRAQIDGELRGEVLCRGTLRLGPDAIVQGNIEADELIIGGRLLGNATARDRIELCGTARVEGAIRAPRVALADGCLLEGTCETVPATAPPDAAREAVEVS
jgi:cytoskeletal protein CcmA (bactofilin family)